MNEKIKEMMMQNPQDKSEEYQKLFFDEFRKSTLLLPLSDEENVVGLTEMNDNSTIVPFFTDEKEMERFIDFKKYNVAAIRPEDALPMISEIDDVKEIVIDPGSPHSVSIPIETFMEIPRMEFIHELEEIIENEGMTLPEDTRFYLREKGPMMKEESENGIFTSPVPFQAGFRDNFSPEKDCLNILTIPKGTKFITLGSEAKSGDTIFAPPLRFKLVEEKGNVYTWKYISSDMDEKGRNYKFIYLIIAIVIIAIAIAFIKLI
ncbi:MAG: SseB family protein [Methanobrevibacter sp.]|uniref:SseB family protein n=1 Tax=Methanobrevibacter sp. TaxID=66852 RepID=UPI0026DFC322|nr:SseB family protein [Methanobrevibacter sp.]MDO5849064.1 SseB family protein [Methanobrevibacter sp.]